MSVTITGNIKDLTGTAIITNCFVRFWLRGLKGNVPRVNGVALVAQKSSNDFYFDLAPNASGAISGTLYSNDVNISAGGQVGVTWYDVQVFIDGGGGAFIPYLLADGTTFDLTSATPITSNPVAPVVSGDTTYARLDGGNTPFTAIIQFLQGIILGAGKLLAWGSSGTGSVDTGISRTAAKTLAVGNGTQGDATGTLNAAVYQVAGVAQSGTGALAATGSPALTTPNIGDATAASVKSGVNPALTGILRVPNNTAAITSRNQANTADTDLIKLGTDNRTHLLGGGADFTIPVATDTAVGKATIDTLTNKTLTSPAFTGTQTGMSITSPAMTSPTINTGVSQGSGFKHQRFGATCTTAATADTSCSTTYTWTSAFADTNYTAICQGEGNVGNIAALFVQSHSASQITVAVITYTASAVSFSAVNCIAVHD